SGWPSVTDSDVNRWTSRSLIIIAPQKGVNQKWSTDGPAPHDTIEECGQGMERGQGDVLAPRLQPAGERAGDAAAAAGAGDGERDLRAVEAGDDTVRD